jgi:hypothetical protein
MNKKLVDEAKRYGINASQYNLLPERRRESMLRKDVDHAKATIKKGNADGQN